VVIESSNHCDSLGDLMKIENSLTSTEIAFHKVFFSEMGFYDSEPHEKYLPREDGYLLSIEWGCFGIGVP